MPLFTKLKSEGKTSTAPIKDSFGSARSWRTFFLVLLGAAAGQAVVWYTGQFYVNTWMKSALKMNASTVDTIVAIALLLGMPFFVVMGSLSDRIGRKKVMMTGNLLAAVFLYPIFLGIQAAAGPITPAVKDAAGKIVTPAVAATPNTVMITLLIFVMLLFVTMVYGPIAAFLVDPSRPEFATRRCRCPITSAMATSAAGCPSSLRRWWQALATSLQGCGSQSA